MTESLLDRNQARALSAPSRRAILTYLAGAGGPVTVAELTDHLGLNHNAVRKHLAQLVDAQLVSEERERRATPGRPKLLYRARAGAPAAGDQAYRRLAVLLATALATGADPAEVGRRHPACLSIAPDEGPVDTLTAQLRADGFEPTVRRRGGRTELVLHRCPYADAAAANPDAVCRLHLGLAQASAATVGGLEVVSLLPKNPRRAGCVVGIQLDTA